MYLIIAATEMELTPIRQILSGCDGVEFLVTGVGMVEATLALSRKLYQAGDSVGGVVNFGVAGAYVDTGVEVLDLCLAQKEVIGDLGISLGDRVESFVDNAVRAPAEFSMQNPLTTRAINILSTKEIAFYSGVFVTVNAVSGKKIRGDFFCDRHQAICENMEGAAIARTCAAFGIDCLELRSVSNMVEDRDPSRWRLDDAIGVCAEAAAKLIPSLLDSRL